MRHFVPDFMKNLSASCALLTTPCSKPVADLRTPFYTVKKLSASCALLSTPCSKPVADLRAPFYTG